MQAKLAFFSFLIAAAMVWPAPAQAQPDVTAGAAALMDADSGVFYYAKNATERRDIASLTKVMTCILAEELANPKEVVEISPEAAGVSVGSIIDIRAGELITLGELVKAALVCSANDSTVAIAEGVAGDHDTFIRWMNAKALLLGMTKTRFANTNGYTHPSHYSTARDMAVLAGYALRNPDFARLVRTKRTTVYWLEPDRKEWIENTNQLLHDGFPGITGVKTGTTDAAGQCLIASISHDGRNMITVVLRSGGRYWDTTQLLNWGMKETEGQLACGCGEYFTRLRVKQGQLPDVPLETEHELVVTVPREEKDLLCKVVDIHPPPVAPVRLGERLGEVVFTWRGQELGRTNLIAGREVKERPWYSALGRRYF